MSFRKSLTENIINQNLLSIEETKEILNIMEKIKFDFIINNKKMKGLLLKSPIEDNNFLKILIVFYEGINEKINDIKLENKSLNINVKLKLDNSRKISYHQKFVFIQIRPNDKIKEDTFLFVDEINTNKMINNKKYVYQIFYTDKIYFRLSNQEDDTLSDIPNSIPIKGSLIIIFNPENHKIISITYYNPLGIENFINNDYIIDFSKKVLLQERKNITNIFSKIINNIYIKPKNDLIDRIDKINMESENSETQLDNSRPSKESENTELNAYFENRRDSIKKIKYNSHEEKIIKSLCNIVFLKYNICQFGKGFFIKLKFNDKQKYFLMTCEHIINNKMINKNVTIKIIYDLERKLNKIKLDRKERIIQDFKFLNIDATIIEIIEEEIIKEANFLSPCITDINECKDKNIFIVNYSNENLYINNGSFISINPISYQFYHSLNTNNGSSGSPIFLKDTDNVIGIHTSKFKLKNFNLGNFIYPIVSIISNGNSLYKNIKYGKYEYEGEMKDNKREGYGKLIVENGIYYIGQWKNGIRHGQGTLYNKDNSIIYEGDFENDKYNGKGKSIEEKGYYYIGQWKDGLKHGLGKYYNKNNSLIYEGNFENGKFNGLGQYFENNEKYYIGQFSNNEKDEVGIEINKKEKKQTLINFTNNSQKYFYPGDDFYIEK